jgi:KDO2-lipid IV(A) lauroyltransferase
MYYLIYGFLYLFSLLPFWILYGISNFAYVLLYYVIGYRKDLVLSNLAIAFPEKSLEERKRISKEFYRNFTDNFIEIIKLLSISEKELQKRFAGDADNINEYYSTGRNVQVHLGHFFNWEYANLSMGLKIKYRLLVVYMPITSAAMNKIFYKMRSRFHSKLIAATSYLKEFRQYRRERFSLVFVYDQSAGNTEQAYWLPFFDKLTPFVTGPEKSAHLNNTIVFYAKFKKIKRGYYYVEFVDVNNDVKKLPEGELTRQMIKHLEANIKEQPENYLWTHRRWKHTFDPSKHRAL